MTYTVKRISPEFVSQRWDEVKDYIASALVYADNDYSLDQVKVFLVTNSWLLLGVYQDNVIKGAITVSFMNMPNDRIAFITTIGGKHISNPQAYQEFITILKQFGATKIQGGARESVARLWRRLGFRERYTIVEKQI